MIALILLGVAALWLIIGIVVLVRAIRRAPWGDEE